MAARGGGAVRLLLTSLARRTGGGAPAAGARAAFGGVGGSVGGGALLSDDGPSSSGRRPPPAAWHLHGRRGVQTAAAAPGASTAAGDVDETVAGLATALAADRAASALTPAAIVEALNRFIVGQDDAKRAVAVALRNRWRRFQLPEPLRSEVVPKNILMIGPTGCGKTEIARRLAKLTHSPFVKARRACLAAATRPLLPLRESHRIAAALADCGLFRPTGKPDYGADLRASPTRRGLPS